MDHERRARVHALLVARRPHDALPLLAEALGRDPGDAEAHGLLAEALLAADRAEEALAATARGLAVVPGDPDLLRTRADVLVELGRGIEAIAAARAALAGRPDDPFVAYTLLRALLRTGRSWEAPVLARRIRALAPADPIGHQAEGLVAIHEQRWGDAEVSLRAQLALTPDDPSALNNLAVALDAQRRSAEAVALYEQAGRHDPRADLYRTNLVRAARRHVWRPGPRSPWLYWVGIFVLWSVTVTIGRALAEARGWSPGYGVVGAAVAFAVVAIVVARRRRVGGAARAALAIDRRARLRLLVRPWRWQRSTIVLALMGLFLALGVIFSDPPEEDDPRPPFEVPSIPTFTAPSLPPGITRPPGISVPTVPLPPPTSTGAEGP